METIPTINLPATGANIRRLRCEAGMTVREVQNIFGFETPQAIYKWERGACLPAVENLVVLGKIFGGVALEEILCVEETANQKNSA